MSSSSLLSSVLSSSTNPPHLSPPHPMTDRARDIVQFIFYFAVHPRDDQLDKDFQCTRHWYHKCVLARSPAANLWFVACLT